MAKAGELRFVVTTDASGAITDIKKVTGGVDKLDEGTKKATNSWGKLGRRIAAAVSIYAASRLFQNIGKAAIDAAETTSKFGVVFENEISKATDITKELVASYGFSVTGAEAALSSVGDLAQGLGIASDESLRMAEATAKFATDLVSFTNVAGGTERAIDALTKAQLGEREMLKAYGIAIHEADVQQRLYLKGQQNLEGAALKAAKAQAVLELAMEQSKNAIGDFARTAESPANMLRILESRVEDFKVGLGKAITEQTGFRDSLKSISDILQNETIQKGLASIISLIVKIAAKAIEATAAIIEFFTQADRGPQRVADQTEQLTQHYERQRAAIEEAGISIKTYFDALQQQPEFKRIQELNELIEKQKTEIADLTEVMENSSMGHIMAPQIEERQKRLNDLLLEQTEIRVNATREIIKNAQAYGISEKEVNDYTKSLLKGAETTVKMEKAITGVNKDLDTFFKEIDGGTKKVKTYTKEVTALIDVPVNDSIEEITDTLEFGLIPGLDTTNMLLETSERLLLDESDAFMKAAREAEEHNRKIQDGIFFIIDFTTQLLDFVGVSDEVVRGLEGLASGFLRLTSGDILGGISSLVGGVFDLVGGLFKGKEKTEELGEEFRNAAGVVETIRGTEEFWESYADSTKNLIEFLQIGAESQEEFNNQTQIALGHFAAMINSGASYIETLQAMEEPFGLLQDSMEEFGFTGNDTFNALIELQQKAAENEQLISSIGAFNQLLIASKNLIAGNEEQFTAYANQALMNYEKLIENEFTQQEALLLSAPALQQLQELQKRYGFQVDETTQKLIDEADSLGLFKTDPLDKIVEVLELIAVQLGVVLPNAAETGAERAGKAFDELANRAIRDFERMGNSAGQIIVPVVPGGGGNQQTQPPLIPIGNTPGFANGGGGTIPPGFNNDDFFFRASSGEQITVSPANGGGAQAGTTNVSITNNVPQTFNVEVNPRQVMDAVIEAGEQAYRKQEFERLFS